MNDDGCSPSDDAEAESETSLDSEESSNFSQSTESSDQLPAAEKAAKYYYYGVVSIVDKLFDASILIRGATRNFRTSKAAAYIERDCEGQDILEEFKKIVSLKIKGLCPGTSDWLVERLTKAIAMRRQQFYYQRAHKGKMAWKPKALRGEAKILLDLTSVTTKVTRDVDFETTSRSKPRQMSPGSKSMKSTTTKSYETTATDPSSERTRGPILVKLAPSERQRSEKFIPRSSQRASRESL